VVVKITVSLDTQAVITQPSPLRIKAGAFVSVGVAFTRGARSIALSEGAVIELAVKPRNQWTGGLLAYLNAFELESGKHLHGHSQLRVSVAPQCIGNQRLGSCE
jgi:hypothetical protein